MKHFHECSRRCARQAPLVQLVSFIVMFLCVGVSFADAVDINVNVWLNQPQAAWLLITGQPSAATAVRLAIVDDLAALVKLSDADATVAVTALTPYSSETGLAYGANVAFTVTSNVLTEADILLAVRGGSLVSTSTAIASFTSVPLSIRVLAAESPASMTAVGQALLLPVTGSTFAWSVAIDTIHSSRENAILGLTVPLEEDLQLTVDSTRNEVLVVADTQGFIANASSMYLPYALWAFPEVAVTPTMSSDLQALAKTSKLLSLNAYLVNLPQVYPAMTVYNDILPTGITPWTPLPGNPFDPNSEQDASFLDVISQLTGNFFLIFSGEAGRWGLLLNQNYDAVSKSITEAIEDTLDSSNLLINATVVSATTLPNDAVSGAGLQVLCRVVQGVTELTMHVWSPEEMAAMLLQVDYSALQTLYGSSDGEGGAASSTPVVTLVGLTPFAETPGSIISTRVDYDYRFIFTKELVGIIAMSGVIAGLVLIVIIVSLTCCCCCEGRLRSCMNKGYVDLSRKASRMDDPEGENDIEGKPYLASEGNAGPGACGPSGQEYQNAPNEGHHTFKHPNPLSL